MMKRFLSVMLCIVLLGGLLAGCSSKKNSSANESKKDGKIPIRFMYWNKEESMKALIDLINKKLPNIDFQYEYVDVGSFQTVYKTQMAAGEGPDLLSIEKISTEAAAGYPLDLSNYDFVKSYTDSVIDEMSYDGKVYAVPGPSWFGGYFYNKGLFEEKGWSIPKTYDEFLALCGKIQEAGIKPLANPLKNPNFLMHYAISYVQPAYTRSEKGMNFDRDFAAGKVKMADTWGPYLEKWAEVVKKGYVKPDELGMDIDQALDEFATGKAAMLDSGPWDMEMIYAKNPEMKLDMMPYVGDDDKQPGWLFGGPGIRFGINAALGESKDEEKLKACLDILELISTEEGQKAYWENNKGGSSYLEGVTLDIGAEFEGCADTFAAGNVYASFMQWNSGVFEEFGKQLQGYVAGDRTLKEVMEATDAKNAEVLEKMGDVK